MGAMAWPAPSPGAPLEAEGDLRPREMTVHDGIRLIGLLGIFASGLRGGFPTVVFATSLLREPLERFA